MKIEQNGREQTDALAKHWQPDNLAGFKAGDQVRLPSIDCQLEVTALQPPSTLVLKAPSGRELRAGWAAVRRVRTKNEMEFSR